MYERLNAENFQGAVEEIMSMSYGHETRHGKVVKKLYRGLVERRTEEAAPFRNAANAPIRSAAK